jgi:hypothetical protein
MPGVHVSAKKREDSEDITGTYITSNNTIRRGYESEQKKGF